MRGMIQITAKQLRKAATLKERLEKLEKELEGLLGGAIEPAEPADPVDRRKTPAMRRHLARIMRARWRAARKAGRNGL